MNIPRDKLLHIALGVLADTGVTDFFVSALGATTFTITYSGGGTHAFYWRAEF